MTQRSAKADQRPLAPDSVDDNTFITNVPTGHRPRPGATLQVVEGPDAPMRLALPPGGATVGTATSCTLRLSDPRVSRNHLRVMADGDGFRVHDLGSSNGSFIAGERVDNVRVPAGTLVQLGKTTLRVLGPERGIEVPASRRESFGRLLGRSEAMRQVFGVLERVVSSNASVLIEGETGTGKELVARSLHEESRRSRGPFVALDCGAIPPDLMESELLGHVRGAFTGATANHVGAFERAEGGTLFLDELGELPLHLQPKLLRVLETREVRPVGGTTARHVDVRVVSGTNRALEQMVEEGRFRADLYFRLAVVQVLLPALRERREDLPLYIEKFLTDLGVTGAGPIRGPNLDLLLRHPWPGNVRELRNVLERAVACAGTAEVRFAELSIYLGRRPSSASSASSAPAGAPAAIAEPAIDLDLPFAEAKEAVIDRFERKYLTALLEACGDNVTDASRRSGINRRHLYDLLKKHGLRT